MDPNADKRGASLPTHADYNSYTWREIETAITGGADINQDVKNALNSSYALSSPASLHEAAGHFLHVQRVLETVRNTLEQHSKAIAGPGGPWHGDGADAFRNGVDYLGKVVQAHVDQIAGPNLPRQLMTAGDQLQWAMNNIEAIDSHYAGEAKRLGADSNDGRVLVSTFPQVVDAMTSSMRQVIKQLASGYEQTYTQFQSPPADPRMDITSGVGGGVGARAISPPPVAAMPASFAPTDPGTSNWDGSGQGAQSLDPNGFTPSAMPGADVNGFTPSAMPGADTGAFSQDPGTSTAGVGTLAPPAGGTGGVGAFTPSAMPGGSPGAGAGGVPVPGGVAGGPGLRPFVPSAMPKPGALPGGGSASKVGKFSPSAMPGSGGLSGSQLGSAAKPYSPSPMPAGSVGAKGFGGSSAFGSAGIDAEAAAAGSPGAQRRSGLGSGMSAADAAAARAGGGMGSPGYPMGPMAPMGGGAPAAGAPGGQERQRTTWLVEDEDVWGTNPNLAPPMLGRCDNN